MQYALIFILIGVAGLTWVFAATYTDTASSINEIVSRFSGAIRVGIALLTLYVMLTAGGIVFALGLGVFAAGILQLYFNRDGDSAAHTRDYLPSPIRWTSRRLNSAKKMLLG
jgi:hypothetical protein